MSSRQKLHPETLVAQADHFVDSVTGGVVPPIQPSTTFARDTEYRLISDRHSYGRDENPGYQPVEDVLARLEGADAALVFSSGMAAAAAVVESLDPGDRIVVPRVMYWGLRGWLVDFCARWGLTIDFYDADAEPLGKIVSQGKTALIWVETPCNPTWDVFDIAAAAEIAQDAGRNGST